MTNNMSTRRIRQPVTFPLCAVAYQYINAIGFYSARWRGRLVISPIIPPFIRPALPRGDRITISQNSRCTPACTSLADAPLCDFAFSFQHSGAYALYYTRVTTTRIYILASSAALSTLTRRNAEICLRVRYPRAYQLKGLAEEESISYFQTSEKVANL